MTVSVPNPFLVAADILDPPTDPWALRPVEYATEQLGDFLWSKQREIVESVRDNMRTAVRSCHGVGKTRVAADVALTFLATHRNSRVVTTAPTWTQVEQLLWREIRAGVTRGQARRAHPLIFPDATATKLELGEQWFAIGQSTNQPERFQGHHADHLLLIVDEASGVDEAIYEAAEGFLTAEGSRVLLIGNPTRAAGQFHRAFTSERAMWNGIHISAFDSPNLTGENVPPHVARALISKAWVDEKHEQWGPDSPMYQVRVLGDFAAQDSYTVIGLHIVETAQARRVDFDPQVDRVVVTCDVARFGDDETVIAERIGQRVRIVEHYVGRKPPRTATGKHEGDIVNTADRIEAHLKRHPKPHVRAVVDDTGVGGGVTDILRGRGWWVTAFNAGEKAHRPHKYPNRRSELWFEMAATLPFLDLDGDEQLAADLIAPMYKVDEAGRRVVERKADTKKRLARSPDRADAVNLTLVGHDHEADPQPPEPAAQTITGDLMDAKF